MVKDKEKSVSKLTFMDPSIGFETQPMPQPKPVKSRAAKLVIPAPVSPPSSPSSHSSEELEVFIGFELLYPLLTNFFSTGDSVTWSLFPQEAQGCFHCCDQGDQGPLSQSAGARIFSEGHTGTPIIVAGAFPKLHLRLSAKA
jgi:hypothetical protein